MALLRYLPLIASFIAFSLALPRSMTLNNRQSTDGKLVVAHVIVGNVGSYTLNNWKSDIALAQSNGLDGFVLNIGANQQDRVSLACAHCFLFISEQFLIGCVSVSRTQKNLQPDLSYLYRST